MFVQYHEVIKYYRTFFYVDYLKIKIKCLPKKKDADSTTTNSLSYDSRCEANRRYTNELKIRVTQSWFLK